MQFKLWLENTTRYSIEMNYRTTKNDVLNGYAKLTLGYLSAAMKNHGYHIKHVFNESPIRICISTRNWGDGEWTCVVSFNEKLEKFIISKGFYNKLTKSVAIQKIDDCKTTSAADLTKEVLSFMHTLEKEPNKPPKLNPPKKKRGPK